nr:MAG TPA: polymerase accessory protein [Caudoviricetes sp.]
MISSSMGWVMISDGKGRAVCVHSQAIVNKSGKWLVCR